MGRKKRLRPERGGAWLVAGCTCARNPRAARREHRGVRSAFPVSQRLPNPPGPHPSALSRLTRPPRAACGGSASPAASAPPPSFSRRRPAEVRLTTRPALRPGPAPAASRSPLSPLPSASSPLWRWKFKAPRSQPLGTRYCPLEEEAGQGRAALQFAGVRVWAHQTPCRAWSLGSLLSTRAEIAVRPALPMAPCNTRQCPASLSSSVAFFPDGPTNRTKFPGPVLPSSLLLLLLLFLLLFLFSRQGFSV